MTKSAGTNEVPPTTDPRPKGRTTRYIVLLVLLVGYSVGAILYQECTVTRSVDALSKVSTTTVCAPPTVTSAVVLVVILLAVILLWPDLTEITVLGVSLKRQVAQATARAVEAEKKVTVVEKALQVQQLRIDTAITSAATATATASSTNHIHIGTDRPWSHDEAVRLRRFEDDLIAASLRKDEPAPEPPPADVPTDSLSITLLRKYEFLAEIIGLGPKRPNRTIVRNRSRSPQMQWFVDDNAAAIQSVRNLRNAIAHGQPVERRDVEAGLSVIETITRQAKAIEQ